MRWINIILLSLVLLGSTSISGHPPAPDQSHLTRVEKRAWNSSVTVWNGRGYGSGTYVTYEGWHLILTAAHVVVGSPFLIIDSDSPSGVLPALPVYVDQDADLALLMLPAPLDTRKPLAFGPRRVGEMDIGEDTVYVGSPNGNSRLLLEGRVVGELTDGLMWVESLTYFGASGSAVFDNRGRFIGVVRGMDVAMDNGHALENLVVVSPMAFDWEVLHWLATSDGTNPPDSPLLKPPEPEVPEAPSNEPAEKVVE